MMRRFLVAATLATATACGNDSSSGPDGESVQVRFVHAIADTGAVDVRVNTALDPSLTAIPFGSASPYLVQQGTTLSFSTQPSPSTSADQPRSIGNLSQIQVANGGSVTVLGAGLVRDTVSGRAAALSGYLDDRTPPAAGQGRLRFINGTADADGLDVYLVPTGGALPTTPTFSGVDYRSAQTRTVAPGTYTVTVTALSDPATVLVSAPLTLADGVAQTIVAAGFRTLPSGVPASRRLQLVTMVNRAP